MGSILGQILSSAARTPGGAEGVGTGAGVAMGHSSIPCEAGPAKAWNRPDRTYRSSASVVKFFLSGQGLGWLFLLSGAEGKSQLWLSFRTTF